jgi:hypothetical protein
LSEFDCPSECGYLENEALYQQAQKNKELSRLLETVPSGQFNDILQDSVYSYAEIAYQIEKNTATAYANRMYVVNDQKVKEAYYEVYRMLKADEPVESKGLSKFLLDLLLELGKEKKWNRDDIGLVLLRLIISVKKMSGGALGNYSYLDYIRDEILSA